MNLLSLINWIKNAAMVFSLVATIGFLVGASVPTWTWTVVILTSGAILMIAQANAASSSRALSGKIMLGRALGKKVTRKPKTINNLLIAFAYGLVMYFPMAVGAFALKSLVVAACCVILFVLFVVAMMSFEEGVTDAK